MYFCKILGSDEAQLLVRKTFDMDKENPQCYQIVFEIFDQVSVSLVIGFSEITQRDNHFNMFGSEDEYTETYNLLLKQSDQFRVPKNMIN